MKRIELLASLAKDSKCLADIGCDHGLISITAVLKYNVQHAYACDVNQMPLNSALKNINANSLADKIETILSNGYENVCFDFDTTIIAGMGGGLIIDILSNYIDKLRNKKIILQPNKDAYMLRAFMQKNDFSLNEEYAIYDYNKYYEILVYESGKTYFSDLELKYGPLLMKNKEKNFIKRISFKRDALNKSLKLAKQSVNICNIQKQIVEIDEVLNDGKDNASK